MGEQKPVKFTAGDKLLEKKLIWRAEYGNSYMGLDSQTLLNQLRVDPSAAWDMIERHKKCPGLRKQTDGSFTKKRKA